MNLEAEWERVAELMTPELLEWAEESTAIFYADFCADEEE